MKRCTTCQEEFADKFSFCPVDGTPLKLGEPPVVAPPATPPAEPRATVSTRLSDTFQGSIKEVPATAPPAFFQAEEPVAATSGNLDNAPASPPPSKNEAAAVVAAPAAGFAKYDGDLHLTILEEKSLVSRLGGEVAQIGRASQLTWPAFKRDPLGFVKRTITGYGAAIWGVFSRPAVATALLTSPPSLSRIDWQ